MDSKVRLALNSQIAALKISVNNLITNIPGQIQSNEPMNKPIRT
jgi:hypothetical protein